MHQENKILITSDMKTSDTIIGNSYLLLMLEYLGINLEVQLLKKNEAI
jgi:hypothetical protein